MAVKVKDDPASSAIDVADVASVIVGALSFSEIVNDGVLEIVKFPSDDDLFTIIFIVSSPS